MEDFVGKGLLTKEEFLRIKKDRAILEWQDAVLEEKKKR